MVGLVSPSQAPGVFVFAHVWLLPATHCHRFQHNTKQKKRHTADLHRVVSQYLASVPCVVSMRVSHMLPLLLLCAVPSAAHEDHDYDYDIVEGDIQVPREGRSGKALSASPLTSQSQLFPLGKVRYYIETKEVAAKDATPMEADDVRVVGAIADWEAKTCIRFTKCTSANRCARPYIKFIAGGGCSSPVGTYSTRVNTIILGSGCPTGTVIHEIGHSLGMLHEQSRKDRDEYVVVDLKAMRKAFKSNFNKMGSRGRDLGAYDYGSIMHYYSTAFSKGNPKTIFAPQPIGQRSSLSSGDVAAIQFMYNKCSANYARPTCMPSIDTTQTHLIPHSKAWNMDFNVMYKSSKSVRVSYAGTTARARQIKYSRAAGSSLGNMDSTELTFTPSAAVAGKTFTLSATFTGTDGPSTTCAVRVRVADDDRLCFGIGASDPNVCSGHGACVEDILKPCMCDSGYAGPDCSKLLTCPADVVDPFDGELALPWKYGDVTEDSSVFVSGGASMRLGKVGSSRRAQTWLDFDDSEAETVSFHMSAMGGGTQQYPAVYLRRGPERCVIVQRYNNGQWRVGNRLMINTAPKANRFYAVRIEFDWHALEYTVLVDGKVMTEATMSSSCAGGITRAHFYGNGWFDEFKLDCPTMRVPAPSAPATNAPRTDAPATDAPKTGAPATSAPRTGAPATDAPATEAPATNSPNTRTNTPVAPETSAPRTGAPATSSPRTSAPRTEAPRTAAPRTKSPALPAPTGCTTTLKKWSNCRKNPNCCPSGTQCFRKGKYYAQCRKTCPATGWSCKVLGGTAAQTPPPPPPPPPRSCNGGMLSAWSNCLQRTACCPSGTQCFEQSRYYAQCRRSCPRSDWTCRVLG